MIINLLIYRKNNMPLFLIFLFVGFFSVIPAMDTDITLTADDINTYANIKKIHACLREALTKTRSTIINLSLEKTYSINLKLNKLELLAYDPKEQVSVECLAQDTILLYYRINSHNAYINLHTRLGIISLCDSEGENNSSAGVGLFLYYLQKNKTCTIEKVPSRYTAGQFFQVLRIDDNSFPHYTNDAKLSDLEHKNKMTKKWELLTRLEASERTSL